MKYKNYIQFVFTLIFFITLSCSDKTEVEEEMVVALPTISKIDPDNGFENTEVIITGENFGDFNNDVKVLIGSKFASITSFDDKRIKFDVPSEGESSTVNVSVSVGDNVSNSMVFTYNTKAPVISGVTSESFATFKIEIEGENFSINKADNIVKFGAIEATVTEATATKLVVLTPDLGTATKAEVTVTKSGLTSNGKTVNINFDKNKIATYNWTTHTVKPGVVYKSGTFTLYGASKERRIFVLDVTLNASNTLGVGFTTNNKSTVKLCEDYNAVAGINAGFFKLGGSSDKNPYVRINGVTKQDGDRNVSPKFTNAALLIKDNVASVRKFEGNSRHQRELAAAIPVSEADDIMVCGPILMTNNTFETKDLDTAPNSRTGLGVTEDGKRVFMVVVDKGGGYTGVSQGQLAEILQALGAVDAMNFDGGGSSTMYVKNQGGNGRVNFPGGGTFQRAVASVIYVK